MKYFFFLLALFVATSQPASANQILFGPTHAVTVTGTSTKIANQNSLRTYFIIVNKSTTLTMYVKFGSVQGTTTDGIPIPPGGNYEPFEAPANSVWVVTPSATVDATWLEGQ